MKVWTFFVAKLLRKMFCYSISVDWWLNKLSNSKLSQITLKQRTFFQDWIKLIYNLESINSVSEISPQFRFSSNLSPITECLIRDLLMFSVSISKLMKPVSNTNRYRSLRLLISQLIWKFTAANHPPCSLCRSLHTPFPMCRSRLSRNCAPIKLCMRNRLYKIYGLNLSVRATRKDCISRPSAIRILKQ